MGKWLGAVKLMRSGVKSNSRDSFVFGLKIMKPVIIYAMGFAFLLFSFGHITGIDFLQATLYTASVHAMRWRTLVQIAPLVDQFTPGILRLIGLGAVIKAITVVGAIGIGVEWLKSQ